MKVKRFDKYTDVMNEVLKGSGVAIYTGEEKEIIVKKIHESIDYIESHAQDTPFFIALADGKLIGSKCPACGTGMPLHICIAANVETEQNGLIYQAKEKYTATA